MGNSESQSKAEGEVLALDDDIRDKIQSQYKLTQKQMKDIDTHFQDLAKDGGISRNKFVSTFTGAGVGAEFAGILFDAFDFDGNKKMTLNEWYAFMGLCMGGSVEDRLRLSFKMFDKNQDGELSRTELVELISLVEFHRQYYDLLTGGHSLTKAGKIRLREMTKKNAEDLVNRLFHDADTNNNNSIDIEEFVTGFSKDTESWSILNLFATK